MITLLDNEEIDRVKWDKCISDSHDIKPYSRSWYLDIMAPGWKALIDDDYDSIFPLPASRRYGYDYVATPVFLQQLGAISPDIDNPDKALEFLGFMPEAYRLIDLCISQKVVLPDFDVTGKTNFELSLKNEYEKLWFNYNTDCRRNTNIAHRYQQDIVDDVTPAELISLFRNNIGKRAGAIRERNYNRLLSLMTFCVENDYGWLKGVRSPKGKLLWGTFAIDTEKRITMLFTAGSRKSRELRTAWHVIDHIIRINAGTDKVLDFAGSSVPSIAMFMKSFGSIRKTYYRLYRNTLPWPLRLFK